MTEVQRRNRRELMEVLSRPGQRRTVRALMAATGRGDDAAIGRDLRALAELGYVRVDWGKAAAITVLVPFVSIEGNGGG